MGQKGEMRGKEKNGKGEGKSEITALSMSAPTLTKDFNTIHEGDCNEYVGSKDGSLCKVLFIEVKQRILWCTL